MALPSDPAFASLAAAFAVLAGVAVASVRGWIRLYGPTYAAGMAVSTLLATNAFVLYTDDSPVGMAIPEAAAEHPVIEAWPLLMVLAGCVLGCVVVAVFCACVEASGRRRSRRKVPLVPGGRRSTGCGWRTLVELVLFLVSAWACVHFILASDYYMAATAKGGDPAAPAYRVFIQVVYRRTGILMESFSAIMR